MKLNEYDEQLSVLDIEMNTILAVPFTEESRKRAHVVDEERKQTQEDREFTAKNIKDTKPNTIVNEPRTNETDKFTRAFGGFLTSGVAPEEFRGSKISAFVIPQEYLRGLTEKRLTDSTAIGEAYSKTVDPGVSIAKAPALAMLQEIGTKFVYRALGSGVYVMPSAPMVVAGTLAETVASPDASISLHNNTLTPVGHRISVKTYFTIEEQAMLNPQAQSDLIQACADSIWEQAAYNFFDNLETDASLSKVSLSGTNLSYSDITALEVAVPYQMANPHFVVAPKVAGKMKATAMVANTISGPVWTGSVLKGDIDGIPATGTIFANAGTEYFGDFGKGSAIAIWGGLEVQYNPYEKDSEGEIKVVARALIDSGVSNYRYFAFTSDASLA